MSPAVEARTPGSSGSVSPPQQPAALQLQQLQQQLQQLQQQQKLLQHQLIAVKKTLEGLDPLLLSRAALSCGAYARCCRCCCCCCHLLLLQWSWGVCPAAVGSNCRCKTRHRCWLLVVMLLLLLVTPSTVSAAYHLLLLLLLLLLLQGLMLDRAAHSEGLAAITRIATEALGPSSNARISSR